LDAQQDQRVGERLIFAEFASASGLPVVLDTIESRPPPEPDILCEVKGHGHVAFELGEVVDPAFEQATSERVRTRKAFRAAYGALPPDDRKRIEDCLGGVPAVFVGFARGTSPGKWRHAAKSIVTILAARSRAAQDEDRPHEDERAVWWIPELGEGAEILVRRCTTETPYLGVTELTPVRDPTPHLLEKKFAKKYSTTAPIELLAYFVAAPSPEESDRRLDMLNLLKAETESPYRRVWLFDWFKRKVVLVHPERTF
jgi:hypothetical protein